MPSTGPFPVDRKTAAFGGLKNFEWKAILTHDNEREIKYLCNPRLNKAFNIYTIFDASENKVKYTDQDLEALATFTEEKPAKILERGIVHWKVLKEGFPLYANGKWVHYEPMWSTRLNRLAARPLERDECVFHLSAAPGARLTQKYVKCEQFTAFLPADYTEGDPIPETVEWEAWFPKDPWDIQDMTRVVSSDKMSPHSKSRGMYTVHDLPNTVFLIDIVVKKIYHFHKDSWVQYKVRDPGWGCLVGMKWQREGVYYKDNRFMWRDPLTMGLYSLETGPDFPGCSRIIRENAKEALEVLKGLSEYQDLLAQMYLHDLTTEEFLNKMKKFAANLEKNKAKLEQISGEKIENPLEAAIDSQIKWFTDKSVRYALDIQRNIKENVLDIRRMVSEGQDCTENVKAVRRYFEKGSDTSLIKDKIKAMKANAPKDRESTTFLELLNRFERNYGTLQANKIRREIEAIVAEGPKDGLAQILWGLIIKLNSNRGLMEEITAKLERFVETCSRSESMIVDSRDKKEAEIQELRKVIADQEDAVKFFKTLPAMENQELKEQVQQLNDQVESIKTSRDSLKQELEKINSDLIQNNQQRKEYEKKIKDNDSMISTGKNAGTRVIKDKDAVNRYNRELENLKKLRFELNTRKDDIEKMIKRKDTEHGNILKTLSQCKKRLKELENSKEPMRIDKRYSRFLGFMLFEAYEKLMENGKYLLENFFVNMTYTFMVGISKAAVTKQTKAQEVFGVKVDPKDLTFSPSAVFKSLERFFSEHLGNTNTSNPFRNELIEREMMFREKLDILMENIKLYLPHQVKFRDAHKKDIEKAIQKHGAENLIQTLERKFGQGNVVLNKPLTDAFGLEMWNTPLKIFEWVYRPELPVQLGNGRQKRWMLKPCAPLPEVFHAMDLLFMIKGIKKEDIKDNSKFWESLTTSEDIFVDDETRHEDGLSEDWDQALFTRQLCLGALFHKKNGRLPLNKCPVCHEMVYEGQNRFEERKVFFHEKCWVAYRHINELEEYQKDPKKLREKWEEEEKQEAIRRVNVEIERRNRNKATKEKARRREEEKAKKLLKRKNAEEQQGRQRKHEPGHPGQRVWPHKHPEPRRGGRHPPPADPEIQIQHGNYSIFPQIPRVQSLEVNISNRVIEGSQNSAIKFSYIEYVTMYTYILQEMPQEDLMPAWTNIYSTVQFSRFQFIEKQDAVEKKTREFRMAQENRLGTQIMTQRNWKKAPIADDELFSDHIEANKLQKLNAVVFPLNVDQIKSLNFETTVSERVASDPLLDAQREQMENTLRRQRERAQLMLENSTNSEPHTERKVVEEAAQAEAQRGGGLGGKYNKSYKANYRDDVQFAKEAHGASDKWYPQRPRNILPVQWKIMKEKLEYEEFQKIIFPDDNDVIVYKDSQMVPIHFSERLSLVDCFIWYAYIEELNGNTIDLPEEFPEIDEMQHNGDLEGAKKLFQWFIKRHITHNLDSYINVVLLAKEMEEWKRHYDKDEWHGESWMDAVVISTATSLPIHPLTVDKNNGSKDRFAANMSPLYPDRKSIDYAPIFIYNQDDHFSLLVEYDSYVTYKMMQYLRTHEDEFVVRRFEKIEGQKVRDMQVDTTQATSIKSANMVYIDKKGNIPISAVIIHEQPWTNYSFFSTCRDAISAHLKLPAVDIPNLFVFIRDWFDHLHNLSKECIQNILQEKKIKKASRTEAEVTTMSDTMYMRLRVHLSKGDNLFLTDDDLWFLATAGVSLKTFSGDSRVLPLQFIMTTEKNNTFCIENDDNKFIGVNNGNAVMVPIFHIHVKSIGLIGGNVVEQDKVLADYYHLVCAADVTATKKTKQSDANPQNRPSLAGECVSEEQIYDNFIRFQLSGHYDADYDHIPHAAGERPPMMASPMYARHLQRTMGIRLGAGEESAGQESASQESASQESASQESASQESASREGAILTIQETGALQEVKPLHRVMKATTTNSSVFSQRVFVTGVGNFPTYGYFANLPKDTYPQANNLPQAFNDISTGLTDHPQDVFDSTFRFNMSEEVMYTFDFKVPRPSLVQEQNRPDGYEQLKALHSQLPENPTFNIAAKSTAYLELMLKIGDDLEDEIAAMIVEQQHLKDGEDTGEEFEKVRVREFGRLHSEKMDELIKEMEECFSADMLLFLKRRELKRLEKYHPHSPPEDEEPWSDAWTIHKEEFNKFALGNQTGMVWFEAEAREMIDFWMRQIRRVHEEAFKPPDFEEEGYVGVQAHALKKRTFIQTQYMTFLRLSIETLWAEHVQLRIAQNFPLRKKGSKATFLAWTSRRQPPDPDFLQQRLKAPVNVALKEHLLNCALQRGVGQPALLFDVCESSFHNDAVRQNTQEGAQESEEYAKHCKLKQSVLGRLANAYYINHKIAKRGCPMTEGGLRALSRTYCTVSKAGDVLFKPIPTVNFIVVECNNGSPMAGQLSTLQMSDPRGISFAFQLQNLMREKNLTLPADVPEVHLAGMDPHEKQYTKTQMLSDLQLLYKVSIFLKVDDQYFLLKNVEDTATARNSIAGGLAAARRVCANTDSMIVNPVDKKFIRPRLPTNTRERLPPTEEVQSEEEEDDWDSDEEEDWNREGQAERGEKQRDDTPKEKEEIKVPDDDGFWNDWFYINENDRRNDAVSFTQFRTCRPADKDSVMEFVYNNRLLTGKRLDELTERAEKEQWGVHISQDYENVLQMMAKENNIRLVYFKLKDKDDKENRELVLGKIFDWRFNVSRAHSLKTAYYLSAPGRLMALCTRGTVPIISVDEARAQVNKYLTYTNEIKKRIKSGITTVEKLYLMGKQMGLEATQTEVKINSLKMKVRSFPHPYTWQIRLEQELPIPSYSISVAGGPYDLTEYEMYTVNLLQFNNCLMEAIKTAYKLCTRINGRLMPLYSCSGMCTLEFNGHRPFAACYNNLRSALEKHQRRYKSDLKASKPLTHVPSFERRLRAAQAGVEVEDMLQNYQGVVQLANQLFTSTFEPYQKMIMRQFLNTEEDNTYYLEVFTSSSLVRFQRKVEQRISAELRSYFDTFERVAYTLKSNGAWARSALTLPFTRNGEICIAYQTGVYRDVTRRIEELHKEQEFLERAMRRQNLNGETHAHVRLRDELRAAEASLENYFRAHVFVWYQNSFVNKAKVEEARRVLGEFDQGFEETMKQLALNYINLQGGGEPGQTTENRLFQYNEARYKLLSRRAALVSDLALKENTATQTHALDKDSFLRNGGEYMWVCPENGMEYVITDRELAQTTIDDVVGRRTEWTLRPRFPAVDSLSKEGQPDVWFNPKTNQYLFQDYERKIHVFSENSGRWNEIPSSVFFIPVEKTTSLRDAMGLIESMVGIQRRDFFIRNSRDNKLHYNQYRNTDFMIASVDIAPVDRSDWRRDAIQTITNDAIISSRDSWQAGAYQRMINSMQPTNEEEKIFTNEMADIMTPNKWSFEAERFLGIKSGNPGFIAIDFGTQGKPVVYDENPYISFRQAWIVHSPALPGNKKGELWVIRRKPFHDYFCPDPERLTTNPTGINARNVERYWGCNPEVPYLSSTLRNRRTEIFGNRIIAFYNWIINPRNWYWDHEKKVFCVFTFTPDMVKCRDHWVQQMVLHEVNDFIRVPERYKRQYKNFIKERSDALQAWGEVEKRVPMPPEMKDRMMQEGVEGFYTNELREQVDKFLEERAKREVQNVKFHYQQYYTNIAQYFDMVGKEGWDGPTSSPEWDTTIKQKKDILDRVNQRQLTIRRKFWSLFRRKFGTDYVNFLINPGIRDIVYKLSPEAFGPLGIHHGILKKTEAERFLETWEDPNNEKDFKTFFEEYDFTLPEVHHRPSEEWFSDIKDFPENEYQHDKVRVYHYYEDWCLRQAEIPFKRTTLKDEYEYYLKKHRTGEAPPPPTEPTKGAPIPENVARRGKSPEPREGNDGRGRRYSKEADKWTDILKQREEKEAAKQSKQIANDTANEIVNRVFDSAMDIVMKRISEEEAVKEKKEAGRRTQRAIREMNRELDVIREEEEIQSLRGKRRERRVTQNDSDWQDAESFMERERERIQRELEEEQEQKRKEDKIRQELEKKERQEKQRRKEEEDQKRKQSKKQPRTNITPP